MFMAEFASKGVAGSGLGLGIAGTALGLLNGLGGLAGMAVNNCVNNCGCNPCSDNTLVNRYELNAENTIASKDSEIALLKSNIYSDQKLADVYERLDRKIRELESNVNNNNVNQAVINQKVTDNFAYLTQDIHCKVNEVKAWASATFVPGKLVMPLDNICPTPMQRYNSWVAPTAEASATTEG